MCRCHYNLVLFLISFCFRVIPHSLLWWNIHFMYLKITQFVCLYMITWAAIAQPVFWLGCSLFDQGIVVWFMAGTNDLSSQCSDWLWCPHSLIFRGYGGLFSVVNTVARAWRWWHTFIVSTETTLPLYLIQIVWNGPHCMCSEH